MVSSMTLRVVAILGATLIASGCATAGKWGSLAVHDAREIAKAPLEMDRHTLKIAGIAAGAIALSAALDDDVRDIARNNSGTRGDGLSDAIGPFGGRYSDRVMAGFLV